MSVPSQPQPSPTLEFDGERFIPGAGVEIAYHHWLRYHLALRLAAGKRVLDVASGEGYGSAMLAAVAREVTAFDANDGAVRHAAAAYAHLGNVSWRRAQIAEFFAEAVPARYDLVTAFEIIEHVDPAGQRELLNGIRRVLAPGGVALVSTPDKRVYTDARLFRNAFHVREMYRREFESLLREVFPHLRMLEQVAFTGGAIYEQGARHGDLTRAEWTDLVKLQGSCEPGVLAEGEYLVALVSDQPVADEAARAVAILDAAKKLVAEELYAKQVELDAARAESRRLREDLAAARAADVSARAELAESRAMVGRLTSGEGDVEGLRRRLEATEKLAERLVVHAGKAQDEVTRAHRLEAELGQTRDALEHLRRMVGVRAVLKARQALERAPRIKRAVQVVTKRLR